MKQNIINTNKPPKIPYSSLTIESHTPMGNLTWDSEKVELYLAPQQKMNSIEGNKLHEKLKDKPVLNATVLDWLLEHQDQIPDSWKGKYVYFWGTIFRRADGDLCVEYLYWFGNRWYWFCLWLGRDWGEDYPAASLARMPSGTGALDTSLSLESLALRIKAIENKLVKVSELLIP